MWRWGFCVANEVVVALGARNVIEKDEDTRVAGFPPWRVRSVVERHRTVRARHENVGVRCKDRVGRRGKAGPEGAEGQQGWAGGPRGARWPDWRRCPRRGLGEGWLLASGAVVAASVEIRVVDSACGCSTGAEGRGTPRGRWGRGRRAGAARGGGRPFGLIEVDVFDGDRWGAGKVIVEVTTNRAC